MNRQPKWKTSLDVLTSVSLIALCGVLIWSVVSSKRSVDSGSPTKQARAAANQPPPAEPISLEGAAIKGAPGARVAILEFSDFQCPFCSSFAENILPELDKKYIQTGKVTMAFRNYPIAKLHRFAVSAAEGAICAGQQGQFWPMHDRLFTQPQKLDETSVVAHASGLGLKNEVFAKCLRGGAIQQVARDKKQAELLGVSSTPAFFVGVIEADGKLRASERFVGAKSVEQFSSALDKLLSVQMAMVRKTP